MRSYALDDDVQFGQENAAVVITFPPSADIVNQQELDRLRKRFMKLDAYVRSTTRVVDLFREGSEKR